MARESTKTCGGCYCDAIRYEIDGDPEYVSCCHCEDCRKSIGAPVVVYSVYLAEQVHFVKGTRKIYESTPGIKRTFCANCGTPLSYEAKWLGQTVVAFLICTMDKPELFPPERHIFDVDRISWFDVADQLPRYHRIAAGKDPVRFGPVDHISFSPE